MKQLNDDPETLAKAHWSYVASVLKAHGESEEVIRMCGHHYITAFVHGWKHAKEDNKHETLFNLAKPE